MKKLDTLSAVTTEEETLGEWMQVSVDALQPAHGQARTVWNARELETLADSITVQGILQPLIVRRVPQNGDDAVYTLVAGERRLRAAKMAGLTHVPVLLREMDDEEAMLAGLTENLQRANLSVLEEGAAFARALELPGFSVRTLGTKLGLERVNKGYIEERVRAHRTINRA